MAGHLPIQTDNFRLALLDEAKRVLKNTNVFYQRVTLEKYPNYRAMFLPKEYNMDEETGLVDEVIIAVERSEDILEYHLNKDEKINQIYLVM
jgi:hypothetical protein